MMKNSVTRSAVLFSLAILFIGYITILASQNGAIAQEQDIVSACNQQAKAAKETIEHAKDDAALSQRIVTSFNGLSAPKDETALIATVWNESQRIASENGITITELHHDRPVHVVVPLSTPTPSAGSQLPACDESTPVPTRASTTPRGSEKMPVGVGLSVLPLNISLHGRYLNVISAIAAFSRSRVLLQYNTSQWTATAAGTVSATVQMQAYPPLQIDAGGGVVDHFLVTPPSSSPSPSPSPSASPGGST